MSQEVISLYENDKRPMRLDDMRIFAKILKCSVADLLSDADNPERLTDEEREVLGAYRGVDDNAKDFIRTSAQAVADRAQGYRPPPREVA